MKSEVKQPSRTKSALALYLTFALLPFHSPVQSPSGDPAFVLELRADPAPARVRPLESLAIQVRGWKETVQPDGSKRRERLRRELWSLRFSAADGWLSKPFGYQGADPDQLADDGNDSWLSIILKRAERRFLLRDTVLFTAPAAAGEYLVEAQWEGVKASLAIQVTPEAPPQRAAETVNFTAEHPDFSDAHRGLAERYAPFVAQETWFDPKSDYLARFDFDGDWRGDNNWDSAEAGSSQAYVYYSAMETRTHWFLVYSFFHPRDYADRCVAGTCHENDNEGLVLTVRKDGTLYGIPEAMETLAHDNVYSYANGSEIRGGAHDLDGELATVDGFRPAVFIESGGHGVYGAADFRSGYDLERGEFGGTGVTYVYRGIAERPRHPNDRHVGYQLLPAYSELWLRAHENGGEFNRSFDDYFEYQPRGSRPLAKYPRLAGSFYGRVKAENKARPFWAWRDRRTDKKGILAVGQWGLDPAYAVSRNLRMPPPFSLEYVFNPYLEIGWRRSIEGQ